MAVYAYKGRNKQGDLVEGTLEGNDSGAIADQLMNTGVTPTDITPFRGVTGGTMGKPDWLSRRSTSAWCRSVK